MQLSATLFNPAYGLFIPAAADLRVLHPNPAAAQVMQEPVLLDDDRSPPDPEHEFLTWFTFAGMVAGKRGRGSGWWWWGEGTDAAQQP